MDVILSIYDIAFICNNNSSNYNYLLNKIVKEVNSGANINDFISYIKGNIKNNKEINISFNGIKRSGNYIKTNRFYYHNELKILPKIMPVFFDEETGEFIEQENIDAFLEIRASYTLENLTEYIKSKDTLAGILINKKKVDGALELLVKRHGIDLLLFMIDTLDLVLTEQGNKSYNVFDTEKYLKESIDNYNTYIKDYLESNPRKSSIPIFSGRELLKNKKTREECLRNLKIF